MINPLAHPQTLKLQVSCKSHPLGSLFQCLVFCNVRWFDRDWTDTPFYQDNRGSVPHHHSAADRNTISITRAKGDDGEHWKGGVYHLELKHYVINVYWLSL